MYMRTTNVSTGPTTASTPANSITLKNLTRTAFINDDLPRPHTLKRALEKRAPTALFARRLDGDRLNQTLDCFLVMCRRQRRQRVPHAMRCGSRRKVL